MAGYQVQNEVNFAILNVACQSCKISELTNTVTFTSNMGIRTGSMGGYEGYVSHFNPIYGTFQFTPPGANMQIDLFGSLCVKEMFVNVSAPATSITVTYPTSSSFSINLVGLPSVWNGSMNITINLN
jgi:hypothetical protein